MPGSEKYLFYDAEGVCMGELTLRAKYATPETEQVLLALHEMNDPLEPAGPAPFLTLLKEA